MAKISGNKPNENGVEVTVFDTVEVYCREKSVTSDEFYKSCQEGNEIKVVLEIKQLDYSKEQYVIYEDELFKVKRTYKTNKENIELHLIREEGLYYE